ncbi:hypothetical protein EAG18_02195 [Pseudoalteromonas sp. J010]|uniref:hypothetical protein n=1 Tax=Pseudoalteromonas sp. J010 TaxID=998465 RepID=UPI000F64A961|nr:hypothetical protein [Pseudoalteromonas sp. J010]RRS10390.1 hypothetical protein EAG18_02195 [Pseudoalteromonas sp. J010]
MWNPFSILSFFYTIAKDAPDPINVQFEQPSPNLLPSELRKKAKVDGFYVSQLWIENLSKRVLENVRINLTSPLEYAPIVRTNKRHGEVEFSYDKSKMELLITRLDPSESLKLSFFPELDQILNFDEPQIIIEGQELSKLMVQLGFYKKYPSILSIYIFTIFISIFTLCAISFSGYLALRDNAYFFPNSEYAVLRQAQERLSKYGCPLIVRDNTDELKEKLQSGPPYHLPTIMEANGVITERELWKKETIAFIECRN